MGSPLKQGDVIRCRLLPWGPDHLQIEVPCCTLYRSPTPDKPRRARFWAKTINWPRGASVKCPGCGWWFAVKPSSVEGMAEVTV